MPNLRNLLRKRPSSSTSGAYLSPQVLEAASNAYYNNANKCVGDWGPGVECSRQGVGTPGEYPSRLAQLGIEPESVGAHALPTPLQVKLHGGDPRDLPAACAGPRQVDGAAGDGKGPAGNARGRGQVCQGYSGWGTA